MLTKFTSLLAAIVLLASSASAQQVAATADWNLSRRPDIQSTTASVSLGSQLVAVRCREGSLDVLIGGLPATQSPTQPAIVSIGPMVTEQQAWTAIPGTPILSAGSHARLARLMKAGGTLEVTLPMPENSETPVVVAPTYRLELPASAEAIDQVLTACNIDRSSDFDRLPHIVGNVTWLRQLSPVYPDVALARRLEGTVELACFVEPSGDPKDCQVVSSSRRGVGFEDAAIRAANGAKLRVPDGADVEGRIVQFQIRFNLPRR